MRQAIGEALDLMGQLAALPLRASRELLQESSLRQRPVGEVIHEALVLGEGLATLPFRAVTALLSEWEGCRPSELETRIRRLEQLLAAQTPAPDQSGAKPESGTSHGNG